MHLSGKGKGNEWDTSRENEWDIESWWQDWQSLREWQWSSSGRWRGSRSGGGESPAQRVPGPEDLRAAGAARAGECDVSPSVLREVVGAREGSAAGVADEVALAGVRATVTREFV